MQSTTSTKKSISSRLKGYGVAAASVAATAVAPSAAEAEFVTVNVNINSSGSQEVFIDIQGFAAGATSISVVTASSAFSQANPLAPYSELMLRGAGGLSQLRMQQLSTVGTVGGAVTTVGTSAGIFNAVNVGSAFSLPTFTNGTFFDGDPNNTDSSAPVLYRTDSGVGEFVGGGVYHFRFLNNSPGGDGNIYNAWATIDTSTAGSPVITQIHVDTGSAIPEPSSAMALLCMGAVGMGAYRRRKK